MAFFESKKCVQCGWPAAFEVRVRPVAGGRATLVLLCSDDCKAQLLAEDFLEDHVVRGWDVFVPNGQRSGWRSPVAVLSPEASRIGAIIDRIADEL